MKLSEALFKRSDISIYKVMTGDLEEKLNTPYGDWEVLPIVSPTLSTESAPECLLDGLFILKAYLMGSDGRKEDCYLEVSMPEVITGDVYVEEHGRAVQIADREYHDVTSTVIPAVAIEKQLNEDMYYHKDDPEVGLEVLRNGLAQATTRWPIAHAMATILRCEKRFVEAQEAYTLAIAECPRYLLYYNYKDRALVRDAIGDAAGAAADREAAHKLTMPKASGLHPR